MECYYATTQTTKTNRVHRTGFTIKYRLATFSNRHNGVTRFFRVSYTSHIQGFVL